MMPLSPDSLRRLAQQAADDPQLRQQLRELLEGHSAVWQTVADLGRMVRQELLRLAAGSNHLLLESLRQQLAAMQGQLVRPSPSLLERLLAERVVHHWLHMQVIEAGLATAYNEPAAAGNWQRLLKRAEQAHRAALKALESYQRRRRPLRLPGE